MAKNDKKLSLFGSIAEKAIASVSNTIVSITAQLDTEQMKTSLESAEKNMKSINGFFDGLGEMIDKMLNTFTPASMMKLVMLSKLIRSVKFDVIKDAVMSMASTIESIKLDNRKLNSRIKSILALKSAIDAIQDIIKTATLLSLLAIPALAVITPGMMAVKLLTKTIMWTLSSMGNMSKGAEKKLKEGRNIILAIGATFALFALTIYAVGEAAMDEVLWAGWGAFLLLVGAAVGMLVLLGSKLVKNATNAGARSILAIGATFALFALTIYAVGEAAMDEVLWAGWGAFLLLVGAAIGVLIALNKFDKDVRKGAVSLAIIGLAFIEFIGVLALLNKLDVSGITLQNSLAFITIIGAAIGVTVLLSKFATQALMGAASLAIIGGAFLVFTGVLKVLTLIDMTGKVWEAFGALAAIIAVGVAVTAGLSFIGPMAIAGAASLAIVGGAMILFALSSVSITALLPSIDMSGVLRFMGDVTISMLAFAGLSVVAALAMAASLIVIPATLTVAGAILIAATSLSAASKHLENYDSSKISSFINSLSTVVKKYAGLSGTIIKAKFKGMDAIAPSLKGMAAAIKSTAEAYNDVAAIDIDFNKVSDNIDLMITSTVGTFVRLANMKEIKNVIDDGEVLQQGFFSSLFGGSKKKGKSTVAKVIEMAQNIGGAVAGIAAGIRDMANMYVDEYDKNGKIIGKRQLTDSDFQLAGEGVAKIVTGFSSALADHYAEILTASLLANDAIEIAKAVATAIGGFGENINIFASGKVKGPDDKIIDVDFVKAGQNISDLFITITTAVSTGTKGLTNLMRDEITGDMDRLATSISNFVRIITDVAKIENFDDRVKSTMDMFNLIIRTVDENFAGKKNLFEDELAKDIGILGENLKKFDSVDGTGVKDAAEGMNNLVEAVNKVDMSKIEKVNDLAKTLSEFSKGIKYNFDGIAQAINGNLVTAVESLKDILDETNETLNSVKEVQEKAAAEASAAASAAASQTAATGDASSKAIASLSITMGKVKTSVENLEKMIKTGDGKIKVANVDRNGKMTTA